MGKSKDAPTPPSSSSFATSSVRIGGQEVASTYEDDDGNIVSEYYLSPEQEETRSTAQSLLNEYLPSLNTLSDEYYEQKEATLKAVQNDALETISETYTPIIDDLKNDIASRFGSLTNSTFLEELNDIESNRADSIEDLSADLILLSNELDDAQLSRNYSFVSLLSDIDSDILANALGFSSYSSSLSSLMNSFNSSNYSSNYSYYTELADYLSSSNDADYTPAYL